MSMKFLDSIMSAIRMDEKRIDGLEYPMLVNPSPTELIGFMKACGRTHSSTEVRGYIDKLGNVYVWPAYAAIHWQALRDMIRAGILDDDHDRVMVLNLLFSFYPNLRNDRQYEQYLDQYGPVWVGSPRGPIKGKSKQLDNLLSGLSRTNSVNEDIKQISNEAKVIKLRGFGRDPNIAEKRKRAEAFLADWDAMTTENPLNPRERIWDWRAGVELSIDGGNIWFSSIRSFQPNTGAGTGVLDALKALARKHQVEIHGSPEPFPTGQSGTKDAAGLERWYSKRGFPVDPEDGMFRHRPDLNESVDTNAGFWITDTGELIQFEVEDDITHEGIAWNRLGNKGTIQTPDQAYDRAMELGWIRGILYDEECGFNWTTTPTRQAKATLGKWWKDFYRNYNTCYFATPMGSPFFDNMIQANRFMQKLVKT